MSVYKAPNGTYYVQASFKNNNGDRKQKKIRGFETKKEAKIAEAEFLLSSKNKINTKYTYEMVYKLFIEAKETKGIKSRSLMNYNETNKKHILPVFGKMLITNINKETIRNWQTVLKQKGYKTSYLKTIQSTFNRVLRWAVEDDYLEKNQFTMEYIKHNEESKDMQVWTPYEFHKFISVVEDKSDALVFQLLYWTGMRKGELMALKFENIDLEKNEIHIRHNYDYRNHMLTSPKTTNSSRDITMTKQLKKLLEEYINHYSGLACFSKNNFLIGIDKPLSTTTLERKKNYYCKLAGVNKIRIHDFRHSHVSLLIDMKQQVFTIAKRLGHSPDMVNNTYGHLFKEAQIRMADDLSALIDEYAY